VQRPSTQLVHNVSLHDKGRVHGAYMLCQPCASRAVAFGIHPRTRAQCVQLKSLPAILKNGLWQGEAKGAFERMLARLNWHARWRTRIDGRVAAPITSFGYAT
jgi:hypothetical protein